MNLNGDGVIIGIIDTGIDYLNEEFMDSDGKSRVLYIWDQTINSDSNNNYEVPFGTLYTNEQINKAIEIYNSGGNPYDVVPSKDNYGHGTGMAGIVGATGKNKEIKGIAPECKFVIVKLSEAKYTQESLGVDMPLLPLGTNNGNHKGNNIFDNFLESISSNVGVVLVTGSGNQGNVDGHVSGSIKDKNTIEVIEMLIAENQKYMGLEMWVDLPDIVEVNLISPSGEETGFIQAGTQIDKLSNFVFEKTIAKISYFIPEAYTGEEKVNIYFANLVPGIWQLKLRIREGEMARYNAWLWQSGLALPGTRLTPSNPYGTLTVPGDSDFVVTVAAYNQNNNNLLSYSGVAFRDEYIDKIDFAAGGVNTLTVGLNNSTQVISGTSLAAAIGAGACALLFQWGIVQGNYPYMYSQSIKTFLRRGVIKRGKDIYPNPQWGYGIINFYKIFEKML